MSIEHLQECINYRFLNPHLLDHALTHSSSNSENYNNERLEFLGDAVVELVISEYIYKNLNLPEGQMTRLRANIVCTESLALAAQQIHLGDELKLGKGEALTGGKKRRSNLANAFEALMGAIFLDSNFDTVKKILLTLLEENIENAIKGKLVKDYKSKLQEYIQQNPSNTIEYIDVDRTGPEHDTVFTCQVVINGRPETKGKGKTKKEAQQEAAKNYLHKVHFSED